MRFGILELRNRVTKPSHAKCCLTLRVTNLKIFIEIILLRYKLKDLTFIFLLLSYYRKVEK